MSFLRHQPQTTFYLTKHIHCPNHAGWFPSGLPGPKNKKGQTWPNLAKFGQKQFQKNLNPPNEKKAK